MSRPHADPEFQAKYDFCRVDCDECARLDREEGPDVTGRGIGMALRALAEEGVL